jgi:hypothetical protein
MKRKYQSEQLMVCHEEAKALHDIGAITDVFKKMRSQVPRCAERNWRGNLPLIYKMAKDYIPKPDDARLNWAQNLLTYATAHADTMAIATGTLTPLKPCWRRIRGRLKRWRILIIRDPPATDNSCPQFGHN